MGKDKDLEPSAIAKEEVVVAILGANQVFSSEKFKSVRSQLEVSYMLETYKLL